MNLITAPPPPIRLTLARDRILSLKRGHPWVFRDSLLEVPQAQSGSLALLRDKDGAVIAQGIYDPESHLAFRACAINPERFDDALAAKRITAAFNHRRCLFGSETNAFRLIFGEGDGLPGLVCDVYADTAVIQLDGAGPGNFWNLPGIADLISSLGGPENVYRKHRSGEPEKFSFSIRGKVPSKTTIIKENGLLFAANLINGQKTGLFLDQRDNRQRIKQISDNRTVLNLFGYNGGFSVYAGSGGALHVTTVDSAKPAIADAVENWRLNGLEDKKHDAVAADAFQYLEDAKAQKRSWDLVIVDPPSFAPGKHHVEKAEKAYSAILVSAIQVTAREGYFAASSCSSHITPEMFLSICEEAVAKAKRRATVFGIYGQPEDHPFPLACRELQYLKFVLLRID